MVKGVKVVNNLSGSTTSEVEEYENLLNDLQELLKIFMNYDDLNELCTVKIFMHCEDLHEL